MQNEILVQNQGACIFTPGIVDIPRIIFFDATTSSGKKPIFHGSLKHQRTTGHSSVGAGMGNGCFYLVTIIIIDQVYQPKPVCQLVFDVALNWLTAIVIGPISITK